MKAGYLSKTQLQGLKRELETLQQQLLKDLEAEQGDQKIELSLVDCSEVHDRGEEAATVGQQFSHLSHINRLAEEVRECQHALQRIESGDYGWCDSCDDEIELNRLMANPVAVLCVSCQTREEFARHGQAASF